MIRGNDVPDPAPEPSSAKIKPAAHFLANPLDGAGPVLDAIESAGPIGADIAWLQKYTGYDPSFLQDVIDILQKNAMTTMYGDKYVLTETGGKARYLVSR